MTPRTRQKFVFTDGHELEFKGSIGTIRSVLLERLRVDPVVIHKTRSVGATEAVIEEMFSATIDWVKARKRTSLGEVDWLGSPARAAEKVGFNLERIFNERDRHAKTKGTTEC